MNEALFFERLFSRVTRAWVTLAIVAACTLAFLGEVFLSRSLWEVPPAILIELGGNFGPEVQSGQAWRLLSAVFLHGGILHIALNMLALWQAGQIVERLFGHLPYLAVYLLAGLAGNLASLWWHPGPVSIGASGAIFGIYGALLAYLLVMRGEMPLHILREIRSSALAFIGYSLFAGVMIPGVDNANHIGGLVSGVVLGAGLGTSLQASALKIFRQLRTYIALAVVAAGYWALWQSAPQVAKPYHERLAFEQGFQTFVRSASRLEQDEANIVAALRREEMSPQIAIRDLSERVTKGWEANAAAVSALPAQPQDRMRKQILLEYATLRRQSAQYLARALETGEQRWVMAAQVTRQQSWRLLQQWKLHESWGNTGEATRRPGRSTEDSTP